MAEVLERQNRAWGASEKTLNNIRRLREGAFAVVTGQQVGLFGGPLLSLFKAASVLALAKQVDGAGVPCVPVFWMATEDHDLAEVNQTLLLTNDFQLAPFTANTDGKADSPVANIRFAEGTNELVARAAGLLGESLAADYLLECYREGETFSGAYAKLFTRLGTENGLILLDPADAELHRIAAPLLVEAIERAAELDEALLERNREISGAGYHEQVKVTPESTPLFALVDGSRVPIHRSNGGFTIAAERISSAGTDGANRRPSGELQRQCPAAAGVAGLLVTDAGVYRRTGGDRVFRAGRRGLREAAGAGDARFCRA